MGVLKDPNMLDEFVGMILNKVGELMRMELVVSVLVSETFLDDETVAL